VSELSRKDNRLWKKCALYVGTGKFDEKGNLVSRFDGLVRNAKKFWLAWAFAFLENAFIETVQ
jgi:hypothetical protein